MFWILWLCRTGCLVQRIWHVKYTHQMSVFCGWAIYKKDANFSSLFFRKKKKFFKRFLFGINNTQIEAIFPMAQFEVSTWKYFTRLIAVLLVLYCSISIYIFKLIRGKNTRFFKCQKKRKNTSICSNWMIWNWAVRTRWNILFSVYFVRSSNCIHLSL